MTRIKKWWSKIVNHALEEITAPLAPEKKLKHIVSILNPKAFESMNVYSFNDYRVLGFAPTIDEHNRLLGKIVWCLKNNHSLITVFNEINEEKIGIYKFFRDKQNYIIVPQEHVMTSFEYLQEIVLHIELLGEESKDLKQNKNKAILQSNIEKILGYTQSLYALQKVLIQS